MSCHAHVVSRAFVTFEFRAIDSLQMPFFQLCIAYAKPVQMCLCLRLLKGSESTIRSSVNFSNTHRKQHACSFADLLIHLHGRTQPRQSPCMQACLCPLTGKRSMRVGREQELSTQRHIIGACRACMTPRTLLSTKRAITQDGLRILLAWRCIRCAALPYFAACHCVVRSFVTLRSG